MANYRGIRVMVLAEDRRTERFAREVLCRLGFRRHDIRVKPFPVGRGSNKDWIDSVYADEVKVHRSKNYQKNLALMVVTDADQLTVADRASRLNIKLAEAGLGSRSGNERIVHWIPKWSIETWILYFQGDSLDEDTKYKGDVRDPDFRRVAQGFEEEYQQHKQGESISTLASLRIAY